METLDTVPDIRPEFSDARACKAWLAILPLTNVQFAHQAISEQVSRLNKFDVPPQERFRILEMLRETVAFLQAENRKKYTNKALPLNAVEQAAWEKSCALWRGMTRGYEICLEAGNALLMPNAPALCHRCLRYTGLHMHEYVHANQQLGPSLWKRLHHFYRIAEANAFTAEAIKDPLHQNDDPMSCNTAYVHALLFAHANPFDLNAKQLEQTDRWLMRWAYKVRINTTLPAEPAVPPLSVDLDIAEGLRPAHGFIASDAVRYLSMEKICSSLRKRVKLLRAGSTPEQLDLGNDCSPAQCETLLVYLHQQWCESATARTYQRRISAELAQSCFSIPAAHYLISGKPFDQPRISNKLSQQEVQQIAVFGRVTSNAPGQNSQTSFAIETWKIADESASGLRLTRDAAAGGRISSRQVVALQAAGSTNFMLAAVRWATVDPQDKIHIGLRLLPGSPQAAAVRPISLHAGNERFVQALLLPAVPGIEEVSTLLIPPRVFQANMQMEMLTDSLQKIVLKEVVERGQDYDRVIFIVS